MDAGHHLDFLRRNLFFDERPRSARLNRFHLAKHLEANLVLGSWSFGSCLRTHGLYLPNSVEDALPSLGADPLRPGTTCRAPGPAHRQQPLLLWHIHDGAR